MTTEQTADKRKNLNKLLYMNSVGQCHSPNDEQAVRWVREGACAAVTEMTRAKQTNDYTELTLEELQYAINYLRNGAATLNSLKLMQKENKAKFATRAQLGKLHYLCQLCAINYVDVNVKVEVGDFALAGEFLREEMRKMFAKGTLTGYIAKMCYTSWINPKIHEFLKQSGLRYRTKMPKATYFVKWDELTREEANELIIRFQKIVNELTERYGAQAVPRVDYTLN